MTETANNGNPLVSVIIPAYNARAFVLEALGTVVAQDYQPLEILVIDDGSTDDTGDLVREAFPQVRIIRQQNAGVAAARNTGLGAATGEFICFLDADDGWFPGKLRAQVEHLRAHRDVGMVSHRWLVWQPEEDGSYRKPLPPKPEDPRAIVAERSGWLYPQLLLDCVVHTSTVMLRADIARRVGGFDKSLQVGEDYDYWLRASRLCRINTLAPVYSFYRGTVDTSLTHVPKDTNYEYLVVNRALSKWGSSSPDGRRPDKRLLAKRMAKLTFDFASVHFKRGSAKLASRSYLMSLKHDPLNWRAVALCLAATLKSASRPVG